MRKFLFSLTIIISLLPYFLFADQIVPYKKIDSVLKKTWDDTYPIEYKSIIKKDLLGKGIMVVKNKQSQIEYMYSFQIFIPRISMVEGVKTENEDGKEIIIKLFHSPSDSEKLYRIELGEFSEKYYRGNVIRWIK